MHYDIKKSSERIRQLRIKSGLTQEQAAVALNVGRSFYSRIESGKNGCSVDLLIQLSGIFDVSIDYIILGQAEHNSAASKRKDRLKEDLEKLVEQLKEFKQLL